MLLVDDYIFVYIKRISLVDELDKLEYLISLTLRFIDSTYWITLFIDKPEGCSFFFYNIYQIKRLIC